MPVKNATITKVFTITADKTVAEGLKELEKHHVRSMPVIDKNNKVIGIFSSARLLTLLLPKAVALGLGEEMPDLDFIHDAVPDIAERLTDIKASKIADVMSTQFETVTDSTPTTETLRRLSKFGSPLPVVDPQTGDFHGIITKQSMLKALEKVYQ